MSVRASDDFPRRVLQRLANGTSLKQAIELERGSKLFKSAKSAFHVRRRRSGYSTTYAMLADYSAQGIVQVDKKLAEWARL